jgi:hypothetical protein
MEKQKRVEMRTYPQTEISSNNTHTYTYMCIYKLGYVIAISFLPYLT